MNIKNMYITKNRPYTKRTKTTKIAVHYIGNPNTSAEANRNYFNSNNNDVSSNYIIGLNGDIMLHSRRGSRMVYLSGEHLQCIN